MCWIWIPIEIHPKHIQKQQPDVVQKVKIKYSCRVALCRRRKLKQMDVWALPGPSPTPTILLCIGMISVWGRFLHFAIGFFAGGYFSPYLHRKFVVKLFALWRQKVVEKVSLSSIWCKLNTFSQPHETVIFHTCNICAARQFELLQGLWTLVWGKNLFSYSCRRWFRH